MKKKIILWLMVVVLVLSAGMVGCASDSKEKSISFAYCGAIGDYLIIYVPKILLEEELGYTAEIIDLNIAAMWAAMSSGEVDTYTGVSMPNQEDAANKYSDTVSYLNTVYSPLLQGWLVPKWVADEYGLSQISDLNNPELSKLFDMDDDGVGDLMGGDAGWKATAINDEELEAYGLDELYTQKVGSEAMIRAAIEGAMTKNEPVLFYYWSPHPFFGRFPIGEDVVWLDDPKEFWPPATAEAFANSEWIAANPKAAELLRQMKISDINDISWSIAQIEENSTDPAFLEQMSRDWIAKHQAEVDSWVDAAKKAK